MQPNTNYKTVKGLAQNGALEIAYELTQPLRSEDGPVQRLSTLEGVAPELILSGQPSQTGQEPILLLIGGWAESSRTWSRQIAYFAPRYTTLTYDRRGLGLSSRPECQENYSLAQDIKDLDAVLAANELSKRKLWVICRSFGAHLILNWLQQPRRANQVEKLVFISAIAKTRSDDTFPYGAYTQCESDELMEKLLSSDESIRLAGLEKHARTVVPEGGRFTEPLRRSIASVIPDIMSPQVGYWTYISYYNLDSRSLIANIDIPSLVISGEEDLITRPQGCTDLVTRLKRGQLVLLPQVGHMPHLTAAPQLNKYLEEFLISQVTLTVKSQAQPLAYHL